MDEPKSAEEFVERGLVRCWLCRGIIPAVSAIHMKPTPGIIDEMKQSMPNLSLSYVDVCFNCSVQESRKDSSL